MPRSSPVVINAVLIGVAVGALAIVLVIRSRMTGTETVESSSASQSASAPPTVGAAGRQASPQPAPPDDQVHLLLVVESTTQRVKPAVMAPQIDNVLNSLGGLVRREPGPVVELPAGDGTDPSKLPERAFVPIVVDRGRLDELRNRLLARVTLADAPGVRVRIYTNPRVQYGGSDMCQSNSLTLEEGPFNSLAKSLCRDKLWDQYSRGKGVLIVVMDNGVSLMQIAELRRWDEIEQKKRFSERHSWSLIRDQPPGQAAEFTHGTMVAYDATIAAPGGVLADFAVAEDQNLKDRIAGVGAGLMELHRRLRAIHKEFHHVVVVNSWAMAQLTQDDIPMDVELSTTLRHQPCLGVTDRRLDDLNYSENPCHPLNLILEIVDRANFDLVFAAGNCNPACGAAGCVTGPANGTVWGASSHPRVLSVTAADILENPGTTSSHGPGALHANKPDLAGLSYFQPAYNWHHKETSAAAGVVAGIVAALRGSPIGSTWTTKELRETLRCRAGGGNCKKWDSQFGAGILNWCGGPEAVPTQ